MSSSPAPPIADATLASQVRRALVWRSGSQIVAQLVQWAATFLVLRLLSPADYGLFAMTQAVFVFLNMLNGQGLASGLVRAPEVDARAIRQTFGMLLVVNLALAMAQVALAPVAAGYYRQPIVAELMRVQAVIYLAIPFIALPTALLSRAMDFRHQARANIVASMASASTALGGALAGWGVWTLVAAPVALFTVRAVMLTWSARALVRPSFDFRGAGTLARYGGMMAAGQLLWFAQSQTDVLIAGRSFSPHLLGIYTTALFLAQIFVSKVVPPLNEVAFSAYARMEDDGAVARGFVRSTGIVMLVALPFYLGLAATAEPLVTTMLGPKWTETVPVVRLLALVMPCMTLVVLLAPACDARGRPGVTVRNSAMGSAILAAAFLVGVRWGPIGLATSWLIAYPAYLAIACRRALPVIGARGRDVAQAIEAPLVAAVAMALVVTAVDGVLPAMTAPARLALLVTVGASAYGGWLATFARRRLADVVRLARG